MNARTNRALIIRFSSVGDIVLSSLLVRAYRTAFPDGQLDFLVKEEYADLVKDNPHLSSIITFPRNGTFRDLLALRSEIRRRRYTRIIDIHDSLRSRFLCIGTAPRVRISKRKLARYMLVRHKINLYGKLGGAPSVALRYLEPVEEFGVRDDGKGLELFFPDSARERVLSLIQEAGIADRTFIGVCPSAKHNTKMWPQERYAVAIAELTKEYLLPVILFGSGNEADRCNEIGRGIHALNPEARVLNLAGRISLAETAAAMDFCSLVITNDSGLMHVAAARKRKIVAIFGPTVRELGFFPFGTESTVVENSGLACRPCTHIGLPDCPLQHFRCMNEIDVPQVVAATHSLVPLP